jgi:RNA polymerase sigma-70 factor (ECF subfamily)
MSPEEFAALFRAHLPEVSRFVARRVSAEQVEDLAADLFELAWAKRDSIPKGLELPWLFKSARYLISNQQRKLANRSRIFATFQEPVAAPSAEALALADLELAQAWKALSGQEQEALSLWAWEGLNHKEIALALEISENAAAIRLSRAKKRLQNLLAESENI